MLWKWIKLWGYAPPLTTTHGMAMLAYAQAVGPVLRAENANLEFERAASARVPARQRPEIRPHFRAWTVEDIRERLTEAADTLWRLPGRRPGDRSLRAVWPDVVRDWLAYGWEPARVNPAAPGPQAISRLDEVLGWLHHLSRDQRMILWARASEPPMSWRRIEVLDAQTRRGKGRQDRQLRNIRDDGEARLLAMLNGTPSRMRITISPDGPTLTPEGWPSGTRAANGSG